MTNQTSNYINLAAICTIAFMVLISSSWAKAQPEYGDDDDESYGPATSNQGSQADNDGFTGTYGTDDNYSPNYSPSSSESDANSAPGYSANSAAPGDSEGDYDGGADDNAAAASESQVSIEMPSNTISRTKRSILAATESTHPQLTRIKRSKHYIGPVYTYVKTDKHANFKWGVKHKVGKKHHG